MPDQLEIFSSDGAPRVAPSPTGGRLRLLAIRSPSHVRFGTASWAFPGWANLVYEREENEGVLARSGLGAYAAHPLLRTVCITSTFEVLADTHSLRGYAAQVPSSFRFVVTAHKECTTPGPRRINGSATPGHFLDADYTTRHVVEPYLEGLGEKAGVLLFRFPIYSAEDVGGATAFADRLHAFLSRLPRGPVYAIEFQTPKLVSRGYWDALDDLGVCHCINSMPGMPDVLGQYTRSAGIRQPAVLVCWTLAKHHSLASAQKAYAPFQRLVDADPHTRNEVAHVCRQDARPVYVIVTNFAEGCSPLTIRRLAEALAPDEV